MQSSYVPNARRTVRAGKGGAPLAEAQGQQSKLWIVTKLIFLVQWKLLRGIFVVLFFIVVALIALFKPLLKNK